MKTYLLIDGNNLAFRVYFALKNSQGGLLHNSAGVPTTIIYGILNALNAFTTDVQKIDRVIVVWDSRSKYKHKISSIYKLTRKHEGQDDLFKEMNLARDYMREIGIFSFCVDCMDADEIIGYLVGKLTKKGDEVIIFSDDSDFFQLIGRGIKLWRPVYNRFVTEKDVEEKFKCKAKYVPAVLGLMGSKKDNVPGICNVVKDEIVASGMGVANAVKMLIPVTSGEISFIKWIKTINIGGKFGELIKRNRQQIIESYRLVQIRTKVKLFEKEERKKLKTRINEYHQFTCNTNSKKLLYKVRQVTALLEIRKINVTRILKQIGVIK